DIKLWADECFQWLQDVYEQPWGPPVYDDSVDFPISLGKGSNVTLASLISDFCELLQLPEEKINCQVIHAIEGDTVQFNIEEQYRCILDIKDSNDDKSYTILIPNEIGRAHV